MIVSGSDLSGTVQSNKRHTAREIINIAEKQEKK